MWDKGTIALEIVLPFSICPNSTIYILYGLPYFTFLFGPDRQTKTYWSLDIDSLDCHCCAILAAFSTDDIRTRRRTSSHLDGYYGNVLANSLTRCLLLAHLHLIIITQVRNSANVNGPPQLTFQSSQFFPYVNFKQAINYFIFCCF